MQQPTWLRLIHLDGLQDAGVGLHEGLQGGGAGGRQGVVCRAAKGGLACP